MTSSRGSSRRSRAKAASKISIVRDPTDDVTVDGSATPPMMSPSAQDDQVTISPTFDKQLLNKSFTAILIIRDTQRFDTVPR